MKRCNSAYFMTYTYNPETVPISENGLLTLDKSHHTLFMKRLREEVKKKHGIQTPLKYYAVGEYGSETQRPHYHAILYNLPEHFFVNPQEIQRIWELGHISCDPVSIGAMAYVCGYVNKQKFFTSDDPGDDRTPEYSVMSKNLGDNFLTEERRKKMKNDLEPQIRIEGNKRMSIPKYYRERALTALEMRHMASKSIKYMQQNPQWRDAKHRHDYVWLDMLHRKKQSKSRNGV